MDELPVKIRREKGHGILLKPEALPGRPEIIGTDHIAVMEKMRPLLVNACKMKKNPFGYPEERFHELRAIEEEIDHPLPAEHRSRQVKRSSQYALPGRIPFPEFFTESI